jgi:YegS/Rv2252/BmrU family lipid kinase
MSINKEKWQVIVNPISGLKKSKQAWTTIKASLEQEIDFEESYTEYAHHAVAIVSDALKNNIKNILCIGGDGTLHDVVNGVMTQNICEPKEIKIAFYSCGTGNDWQRTNVVNTSIESFISRFKAQQYLLHDVGKIACFKNGQDYIHYFINMAGVGFDAFVVQNMSEKTTGRFSYLIGMIQSLFKYNHISLKIESEERSLECKSYTSIIALNKFAGGGMKLAPDAVNNDGLFDVVIVKDLSIPKVLLNTNKMYSGKYTMLEKVESFQTKKLKVSVLDNPENTYTQAEGELIGTGPFEFECLHEAVRILI